MQTISQLFQPFANQHVLVIGATGFVGRHLVYHLLRAGAFVSIYSRSIEKARALMKVVNTENKPVNIFSTLPNIQTDYIFNLAGEGIADKRWSDKRRQELLASRVEQTQELVNWFKNMPPKVLVNASAIGYYGVRAEQILSENDQPVQEFMSDLCQKWEAAAEQATQYGVRVVKTRFGVILGERGALPKMVQPFLYGLGGKIGHGQQFVSWIDINDCIAALAFLALNPQASGAFNLTSPQPVTQEIFAKSLANLINKPFFLHMPRFVFDIIFGEMGKLITCGQRVIPKRLTELGFKFQFPEIMTSLKHVSRMTDGFKNWG
jgi:uncharacterized protein